MSGHQRSRTVGVKCFFFKMNSLADILSPGMAYWKIQEYQSHLGAVKQMCLSCSSQLYNPSKVSNVLAAVHVGPSSAIYQPCSYGNADSLSPPFLSDLRNADSLSPLCAHVGILHPKRQDHWQERGGGSGRGILPHYRDAQHWREG